MYMNNSDDTQERQHNCDKITLSWFHKHAEGYIKEKVKIETSLKNGLLRYWFKPAKRLQILIGQINIGQENSEQDFYNSVENTFFKKCEKYWGYKPKQALILLSYFKMLDTDFNFYKSNNSIFGFPLKTDFNKNTDKIYKEGINNLRLGLGMSLPNYMDNTVCDFVGQDGQAIKLNLGTPYLSYFKILIQPYLSRSFYPTKYVMDASLELLVKKYRKIDKKNSRVFQAFLEIVSRHISFRNAHNKEKTANLDKKDNNKNQHGPEDLLTSKQAAEYINAPISRIYSLTHKKQISYTKPNGGRVYIKRKELDEYLKGNRKNSTKTSSDEIAKDIVFGK